MARCGEHGEDTCSCLVVSGPGIAVTGNGRPETPYSVGLAIPRTALNIAQYSANSPSLGLNWDIRTKVFASSNNTFVRYNSTTHDLEITEPGWYDCRFAAMVRGTGTADNLALYAFTGATYSENTMGDSGSGRSGTGFIRMRVVTGFIYFSSTDIANRNAYLRARVVNNTSSSGSIIETKVTVTSIQTSLAPVVKAARPSSLEDVIAVLQANGMSA